MCVCGGLGGIDNGVCSSSRGKKSVQESSLLSNLELEFCLDGKSTRRSGRINQKKKKKKLS